MKKLALFCVCTLLMFFLIACDGASISDKKFDEISDYVLESSETISTKEDIEFFEYESAGLSIGSVYYGYYYTANNEIAVPDFYTDDNLGEEFEKDGGTYIGKPNNGTDWCFVKKITDNWYYYELHWS